jgi:hypothetical protein
MANGHGGPRPGSGRPKHSVTKRSEQSMTMAAEMGVDPVAMLLSLADWAFKEWQLNQTKENADKVRDYAKEAAPYVSPKLAAVEASGPDGGPISLEAIVRTIVDPAHDRDGAGVQASTE